MQMASLHRYDTWYYGVRSVSTCAQIIGDTPYTTYLARIATTSPSVIRLSILRRCYVVMSEVSRKKKLSPRIKEHTRDIHNHSPYYHRSLTQHEPFHVIGRISGSYERDGVQTIGFLLLVFGKQQQREQQQRCSQRQRRHVGRYHLASWRQMGTICGKSGGPNVGIGERSRPSHQDCGLCSVRLSILVRGILCNPGSSGQWQPSKTRWLLEAVKKAMMTSRRAQIKQAKWVLLEMLLGYDLAALYNGEFYWGIFSVLCLRNTQAHVHSKTVTNVVQT